MELLTEEERARILADMKAEPEPIPDPARDAAIAKAADHPVQVANAWDCLTEFHKLAKAINSPLADKALEAAGFINRLRAAVELPKTPATNG